MKEMPNYTTIAQELKEGKSITFFTKGISMRPLLIERETHVTIAPLVKAKDTDILLYIRKNGALVLHRCMKQDEVFYYMRGDNTYRLERIEKEQAIGRVTHIYRKGKQFAVDHAVYRAYVWFWNAIYPMRFVWQRLKSIVSKILKQRRVQQ